MCCLVIETMDRVGFSKREVKGRKAEWLSLSQLVSKSVTVGNDKLIEHYEN